MLRRLHKATCSTERTRLLSAASATSIHPSRLLLAGATHELLSFSILLRKIMKNMSSLKCEQYFSKASSSGPPVLQELPCRLCCRDYASEREYTSKYRNTRSPDKGGEKRGRGRREGRRE